MKNVNRKRSLNPLSKLESVKQHRPGLVTNILPAPTGTIEEPIIVTKEEIAESQLHLATEIEDDHGLLANMVAADTIRPLDITGLSFEENNEQK